MGEIILSICIGGSLVVSGIVMNLALKREVNKNVKDDTKKDSDVVP